MMKNVSFLEFIGWSHQIIALQSVKTLIFGRNKKLFLFPFYVSNHYLLSPFSSLYTRAEKSGPTFLKQLHPFVNVAERWFLNSDLIWYHIFANPRQRLRPKWCLGGFIFTLEIINNTTFLSYFNSPRKGCLWGMTICV